MGTGANGHLEKRAPQVSCTHFPQNFEMGRGENGHLRTQESICPSAYFALCAHLGDMGTWITPLLNCPLTRCPFAKNWGE